MLLHRQSATKSHKPAFRPAPCHSFGILVSNGPNLVASWSSLFFSSLNHQSPDFGTFFLKIVLLTEFFPMGLHSPRPTPQIITPLNLKDFPFPNLSHYHFHDIQPPVGFNLSCFSWFSWHSVIKPYSA